MLLKRPSCCPVVPSQTHRHLFFPTHLSPFDLRSSSSSANFSTKQQQQEEPHHNQQQPVSARTTRPSLPTGLKLVVFRRSADTPCCTLLSFPCDSQTTSIPPFNMTSEVCLFLPLPQPVPRVRQRRCKTGRASRVCFDLLFYCFEIL